MNRNVLFLGLIAGLITSLFIVFNLHNPEGGELMGYASMIIALSTIFIAQIRYRKEQGEGEISFKKAFQIGMYITLLASFFYVVTWLIVFNGFYPEAMDGYMQKSITQIRQSGKSPTEIEAEVKETLDFFKLYKENLWIQAGMTFLEIFPVGLLISIISSLIVSQRKQQQSA